MLRTYTSKELMSSFEAELMRGSTTGSLAADRTDFSLEGGLPPLPVSSSFLSLMSSSISVAVGYLVTSLSREA